MANIRKFIQENSDFSYAQFNKKFISTSHPILGVRIPLLRKFASVIEPEQINLENPSHEEILLYGFSAAANYKTEEGQLEYLQNILPQIDNWATCDEIVCEMKKLRGEKSFQFFVQNLQSPNEFSARVGIVGLMRNFLKSEKLPEILTEIRKIKSEQYYVKMAIAWLYAELATIDFPLAKQEILNISDKFTRQKAISKSCESHRLTNEQKQELQKLRK